MNTIPWEDPDEPAAEGVPTRRALLRELRQSLDPSSHPGSFGNLDHYEVVDLIGSGDRTVVVMAWDAEKSEYVAAKVVRPELAEDPLACNKLIESAQRIQRVQHPHILPVREVANRARGAYFVMPLAPEGSLARRLVPGVPLDAPVVLQLARQLALAFVHAHSRGLLHNNLKPSNVIVTGENTFALADFGLSTFRPDAALKDTTQPAPGSRVFYIAPETLGTPAPSKSADVYSFGALLYECLAGCPPYPAKTHQEVVRQTASVHPPLIVDIQRGAHFGLAAVSKAAMGRDPASRYPDFSFVLADLDRIARSQPPLGARQFAAAPAPRRRFLGFRLRR